VSAPVVIHVCASLCTRMRDHAHVRLCTHGKPLGSSYHPIIRGFCLSVNVLAMPFSFNFVPTPLSQASGEKRAGEAGATQQAKKPKLPPLTDLVAMESAPKKAGASRLPAVAPLNICCYKITDKAGDAWSQFENVPDAKLWQIQLDHSARPSCLFNLRGSFVVVVVVCSVPLSLSSSLYICPAGRRASCVLLS
jgi:hypothetical protein